MYFQRLLSLSTLKKERTDPLTPAVFFCECKAVRSVSVWTYDSRLPSLFPLPVFMPPEPRPCVEVVSHVCGLGSTVSKHPSVTRKRINLSSRILSHRSRQLKCRKLIRLMPHELHQACCHAYSVQSFCPRIDQPHATVAFTRVLSVPALPGSGLVTRFCFCQSCRLTPIFPARCSRL